jgi:hypothetical protein
VAEAKKEPKNTMALLNALRGPYGLANFDKRTGTKAISTLLASLNPEYTSRYTEELFKKFHTVNKGDGKRVCFWKLKLRY